MMAHRCDQLQLGRLWSTEMPREPFRYVHAINEGGQVYIQVSFFVAFKCVGRTRVVANFPNVEGCSASASRISTFLCSSPNFLYRKGREI